MKRRVDRSKPRAARVADRQRPTDDEEGLVHEMNGHGEGTSDKA